MNAIKKMEIENTDHLFFFDVGYFFKCPSVYGLKNREDCNLPSSEICGECWKKAFLENYE